MKYLQDIIKVSSPPNEWENDYCHFIIVSSMPVWGVGDTFLFESKNDGSFSLSSSSRGDMDLKKFSESLIEEPYLAVKLGSNGWNDFKGKIADGKISLETVYFNQDYRDRSGLSMLLALYTCVNESGLGKVDVSFIEEGPGGTRYKQCLKYSRPVLEKRDGKLFSLITGNEISVKISKDDSQAFKDFHGRFSFEARIGDTLYKGDYTSYKETYGHSIKDPVEFLYLMDIYLVHEIVLHEAALAEFKVTGDAAELDKRIAQQDPEIRDILLQ